MANIDVDRQPPNRHFRHFRPAGARPQPDEACGDESAQGTADIRFGPPQQPRQLDRVLGLLEALPLEAPVEHRYAEIRWRLERAGTPIGPNGLLLAAQALALGLTLVTGNAREFLRVPGLAVENWLEP